MTDEQRKPKWARWDDDGHYPICDSCAAFARWSIARFEGDPMNAITRWFACGTHLNSVLIRADWEMDSVTIYDLTEPVGRS